MSLDPGRSLRRIESRGGEVEPENWPDRVPAVAHLLTHGWDVAAGVTFLVGENGTGKSTLVEAVAQVLGAPAGGGTNSHVAGAERQGESDVAPLAERLRAISAPGHGRRNTRNAFFLRAETMHSFVDYLQRAQPSPSDPHPLQLLSHGESFVEMFTGHWVRGAGVVLLDEPETALSFRNCLTLVAALDGMRRAGKQIICATHSPVLTALPGATILQLDDEGITPTVWDDLAIVHDWRFFLDAPERYFRRLL